MKNAVAYISSYFENKVAAIIVKDVNVSFVRSPVQKAVLR